MNLDDDSYLSAYLDDELDPADRLAIEWAVESSPPLREQLRSLSLARDSVAGLDRPTIPRDLAPIVAARLASNRRKARIRALGRPIRVALTFSGFSAIAASLIFALILLNHTLHPTDQPTVVAQGKEDPANRPHLVVMPNTTPAPASKPIELANNDHPDLSRAEIVPSIDQPPVITGPIGEAKEQADRKAMTRMLEREHVRGIVIVTDIIDAPDRIKRLIHEDARRNPEYARVTICQNIVVDSDHAEAAEVFAVPMDERGRRSFIDRLSQQFPDLVEERDARPELITRLSDVGQVAIFRGTEAAPLADPPSDVREFIANRADTVRDQIVRAPGTVDSSGSGSGQTSPAEKMEGPASIGAVNVASNDAEASSSFVGPPNPYRVAPPGPGDPITLIVWVTRPVRR